MANATKERRISQDIPVSAASEPGEVEVERVSAGGAEGWRPVQTGPIYTAAEQTRASVSRMLHDASLDPARASIEAVAHPENNSTLYRLAYSTLADDEVRFSEWDADIVASAKAFIAAYASSLQHDRNSLAGPLV